MAKNYYRDIQIRNQSEQSNIREWSKILQTCPKNNIHIGIWHSLGNHIITLEIIRSAVMFHIIHPSLTLLSLVRVFPRFPSVFSRSPLMASLSSSPFLFALPFFLFRTLFSQFYVYLRLQHSPPSLLPAFCAISRQLLPALLVPLSTAIMLLLSDCLQVQCLWFVLRALQALRLSSQIDPKNSSFGSFPRLNRTLLPHQ